MTISPKSLVLVLVVGIAVGAISFAAVAYLSSWHSSSLSYTKLTVPRGSWTEIDFSGNRYCFRFSGEIELSDGQTQSYPSLFAIEGAKYEWRGVEIVVSEVHAEYAILLIRPL
jgi:hypothetical protein